MPFAIRITAAFALRLAALTFAALTFAMTVAPQVASAAATKHHHPAKTVQTKKPADQYLRSAAPPDPEHAQR